MIPIILLLPLASLISFAFSQKVIYSFGSSYTATGFNPNGQQPSKVNPLGNPDYGQPEKPAASGRLGVGGTYGGGPNYIDHLVATYNNTLTFSYNYAVGGSAVNNNLSRGFGPDLQQQIPESFAKRALASADDSLFIIFMGDNDVQNNYRVGVPVNQLMNDYFSALNQLYQHNARRFMLVNVPQLSRAPTHNRTYDTPTQNKMLQNSIADYNEALEAMTSGYKIAHSDVQMEIYDFHTYMGRMLDDPKAHGFEDATCEGTGPKSDCIWWQDQPGHVTSRFHDLMAGDMSGTTRLLDW